MTILPKIAESARVYETTEYAGFQKLKGNRALHPRNLIRLEQSISKNNLLAQNPIMVNKDLEIIDGQHRLAAAQELNVPIYYMIVGEGSLETAQDLNANARMWYLTDYLESFVQMGKPEYINLKKILDEYEAPLTVVLAISHQSKGSSGSVYHNFKVGEYVIHDEQRIRDVLTWRAELEPFTEEVGFKTKSFAAALEKVYDLVDKDRFRRKLESSARRIEVVRTVPDYLRQLETIYNFNQVGKVRLF